LQYALDFDNNRQFHYEKIPQEIWKYISKQISEKDKNYDRIERFGFKEISEYQIITSCKPSPELTQENKPEETMLDMNNINNILFDFDQTAETKTKKMLIIRALLMYKVCLLNEFDSDDEDIYPDEIFNSSRLKVFHKLYRKTLQPKVAVKIMIENPSLNQRILEGKSLQKQFNYIKYAVMGLYMKSYYSLKYYKEFVKGNDFSVGSNGYAFNLIFIGLTTDIENFMEILLNDMVEFTKPESYDEEILETIREKIINKYSSFETLSSLKHSTYLLDIILDELEMDFRNEITQKNIKEWVFQMTPEVLSEFFNSLYKQNKLTLLFSGNITTDKTLQLTEQIKKVLLNDIEEKPDPNSLYSPSDKTIGKILDNIIFRFHRQSVHYMIRKENLDKEDNNNVYLTYFRTNKASVKMNLINSMICYWLRNYVFDKLRNQMNLGYVAHASSRDYYYRTGIIILVQGENFRPTDIEKDIEQTILEFMDIIENKTIEDIEDIKFLMLERFTEFSNSLEDVTAKEWDFIETEYILQEKPEYQKIADDIQKEDLIEFCKDVFLNHQKRISIELFAHQMTKEEESFELLTEESLGGVSYELKTVDEMIKKRDESVQVFEAQTD
jgi:secreted Zn-dependent insulinase-like peptidase